ncbi:MAG: glycosyltransferase family 10 [Bacteroidota bacterium]|nr:glycosyltransferase family 10 [Bacteroidota bacterium]
MEILKINFGFFWNGFDNQNNFITEQLSKRYRVEISDDPDFYLFTQPYDGKRTYLKYKCHRIFFGWENVRADWHSCDYVLDSDFYANNPRHKRYPIWAAWGVEAFAFAKESNAFKEKKKFCCMLVSNPKAKERIEFFHKLSAYKKVDSAGRYLNNVGYLVDYKMQFIKDYKFVISFENSSYPGYTSEKLIEPMHVNSIPVYWGNPLVQIDFNTKSFINVSDFKSYDEAIEYIIELDKNEDKYLEMAAEPWLNGNRVADAFTEQSFLDFFDFIIKDSKTKKPVAQSLYHRYAHNANFSKNKILWRLKGKN